MEQKETRKSRGSWIGYGAEFLSIFFALTLLTGRVSIQSYWNEYGLSLDLVNTSFVNYAIASPNTTIASVMLAAITVVLIRILQQGPPSILGDFNPNVAIFLGCFALLFGLFAISSLIWLVDLVSWPSGTAGLAFGTGYLFSLGGLIVTIEACFKLERKPKPENKLEHEMEKPLLMLTIKQWWHNTVKQWWLDTVKQWWLDTIKQWWQDNITVAFSKPKSSATETKSKKMPVYAIEAFFIIFIAISTIWGMLDTAKKFGVADAHTDYDKKPMTTIQLDSQNGFEDLFPAINPNGSALLRVKIITEAGGFLYVSPCLTKKPLLLYVRVVPVSRV